MPTLKELLDFPDTCWTEASPTWYDGTTRTVEVASQTALWYHSGKHPVPIRWVHLTCEMDPDSDPMAVVDQYCRVRGVEGLRVADTSVMPDVVRAYTNTTAMTIGERVADWIKSQ